MQKGFLSFEVCVCVYTEPTVVVTDPIGETNFFLQSTQLEYHMKQSSRENEFHRKLRSKILPCLLSSKLIYNTMVQGLEIYASKVNNSKSA